MKSKVFVNIESDNYLKKINGRTHTHTFVGKWPRYAQWLILFTIWPLTGKKIIFSFPMEAIEKLSASNLGPSSAVNLPWLIESLQERKYNSCTFFQKKGKKKRWRGERIKHKEKPDWSKLTLSKYRMPIWSKDNDRYDCYLLELTLDTDTSSKKEKTEVKARRSCNLTKSTSKINWWTANGGGGEEKNRKLVAETIVS